MARDRASRHLRRLVSLAITSRLPLLDRASNDARATILSVRVFVYGTLMPGELRWPALEQFSVGWERATARGRMWDSGHGYPAVRFDSGGAAIPGVVVTLSPDRLAEAVATLDAIEEEGSLYRRIEIVTSAGSAMTYEWLGTTDGLAVLEQGWRVG